MTEPLDLMRRAGWEALDRLHGISWQFDLGSMYGPLAETLTWITALADAMGKSMEPEMSGLTYARNCLLHGQRVVSVIEVHHPGQPAPLKGAITRFPGVPVTVWGFTDDPDPVDPATGRERWAKRRADFNANVARHEVFPMVDRALLDLGVNIWNCGKSRPVDRRPKTRYTVTPGGREPDQ